jgi:hypothetical protein
MINDQRPHIAIAMGLSIGPEKEKEIVDFEVD